MGDHHGMDLRLWAVWTFHHVHGIPYCLMEKEPPQDRRAARPHVRQDSHLLLYRGLLCPLAQPERAGPMGLAHALDGVDHGVRGHRVRVPLSREV